MEKFQLIDKTRLMAIMRGLLVGVLVGFVVSAFRFLIEISLHWVKRGYALMHQQPVWLLVWLAGSLVLAIGVGQLIKKEPMIKGSGIPQVEGQLAGYLDYPWWAILWRKFVGGVLSIGSGLFLGREGPSIQLGATVGQGTASWLHRRGSERRLLIAGGSAAGLSAAFNAPIASTLFILEEVYHNFSPLVWTTALASALASNFVSLNFFGLVPVLHIPAGRSLPLNQYGALLGLGILLGVFGYLYQRVLLALPKWYGHLKKLPAHLWGIVPFVAIIPVGWFWADILGGGNAVILQIAQHTPTLGILIGMFVLRFVFSMLAYGSGLPGGIFLPILTLGAILGAIYGQLLVGLGWLPAEYVPALIIFAMAGYFAGIGKAPFTAILLITEMVGKLNHLMPLAVVSLTAYVVVDLLGGDPIYAALLERLIASPTPKYSGVQDRVEVPVYAGSLLENRQVRDLQWPKETLLMTIRRGERAIIPHGDTLIHAGDTLVLVTDHANRAWVRHQMMQLASQADPIRNG